MYKHLLIYLVGASLACPEALEGWVPNSDLQPEYWMPQSCSSNLAVLLNPHLTPAAPATMC